MDGGLSEAQRKLRDGLTRLFPGDVGNSSPSRHYTKMTVGERHEAAERIRGIYKIRASQGDTTDEQKRLLRKYESMSDLQVLRAEERILQKKSRDLERYIRITDEAERRARENPGKKKYAGLAA